jgi:hypothetical protein
MLFLSTCVGLRYGHQRSSLEAFLGSVGLPSLRAYALPITSRGNVSTDLPMETPYKLRPGRPTPGWATLLRPPIAQTLHQWYRNVDLFPITYSFRPRLRVRLTLGGLTFPRKP